MRKIASLLVTIITIMPVILYLTISTAYKIPSEKNIPTPEVTVLGKEITPAGYDWNVQILSGFTYKEFNKKPNEDDIENLGILTTTNFNVTAPEGYKTIVSLYNPNDTLIYSGSHIDLKDLHITENGEYSFDISLEKTQRGPIDYGLLYYKGKFKVSIDPEIEINSESINQGDLLALRVYNLFGDIVPTATINSEDITYPIVFITDDNSSSTAFLGFNYSFPGGEYTIDVVAGDLNWSIPFKIKGDDGDYEKVYTPARIDEDGQPISHPNPSSLSNAAKEEFNQKILPLYTTEIDSEKHWKGSFLNPVSSAMTGTGYGAFVYENEALKSRHSGIDLIADEGTSVLCPEGGRVVLAEELANTGNTVVIEHGCGIKSYLYHMKDINVTVGQAVERGQTIGTVGMTGDTYEALLHYEIRIGNQSVDPNKFFSSTGALFYFD